MTFAIRSDDLETLGAAARREGISLQGPVAMSRERPDGVRVDWTILYLEDWGTSPHPSESVPAGCQLRSFAVLHPEAHELARIYDALDIPVPVKRSAYPGFVAEFTTPAGDVVLTHT